MCDFQFYSGECESVIEEHESGWNEYTLTPNKKFWTFLPSLGLGLDRVIFSNFAIVLVCMMNEDVIQNLI